jgi:hypothetical protein
MPNVSLVSVVEDNQFFRESMKRLIALTPVSVLRLGAKRLCDAPDGRKVRRPRGRDAPSNGDCENLSESPLLGRCDNAVTCQTASALMKCLPARATYWPPCHATLWRAIAAGSKLAPQPGAVGTIARPFASNTSLCP